MLQVGEIVLKFTGHVTTIDVQHVTTRRVEIFNEWNILILKYGELVVGKGGGGPWTVGGKIRGEDTQTVKI